MYVIQIPDEYWRRKQGGKATERFVNDVARLFAQRTLPHQNGDMDLPETWIDVTSHFPVYVTANYNPGGIVGEYSPSTDGDGLGTITYNTYYSPPTQARAIVHELGHSFCYPLIPGNLFGEYTHATYDGDSEDLCHRISRRFEDICFGKPRGHWNCPEVSLPVAPYLGRMLSF